MWTVIPPELIWEGVEAKPGKLQELTWQGAAVLVEPIAFAQARIVRILSTDPSDFLRPDLQPGSIIHFPME